MSRQSRQPTLRLSSSLFSRSGTSNGRKKKIREPVAVDAPPLSSSSSSGSDEEEEKAKDKKDTRKTGKAGKTKQETRKRLVLDDISDVSDDDDGRSRRGDIARTVFGTRTLSSKPLRPGSKTSVPVPSRPRKIGAMTEDSGNLSSSSTRSKRRRTSNDDSTSSSRIPERTNSAPSSQTTQPSSLSGSQRTVQHKYGSQGGSQKTSVSRRRKKENENNRGSDSDSSLSEPTAPRPKMAKFIRPRKMSSEPEDPVTPPKKFRHQKKTGVSDDELSPEPMAKFKIPGAAAAGKQKQKEKQLKHPRQKISSSQSSRSSLSRKQKWRQEKLKGQKGAALFGELELEQDEDEDLDPVSQPAVFKMPTAYDDSQMDTLEGGGGDSLGRTEALLDDLHGSDHDEDGRKITNGNGNDNEIENGNISDGTVDGQPPHCPLCNEAVDEDILRDLTAEHGRGRPLHFLRFDDKMQFCAAHRQRAGQKAWKVRGYPDIDWAALDGRVEAHFGLVQRVLEGKETSSFRLGKDDGTNATGRKRRVHHTVPGYYGQRGLRVMSEAIVGRFATLLRQRAVQDRTIAAHGYSQFVEQVLVPEVAMRLIMEDMDVDAAAARRILGESVAIGELLHEAVDVVEDDDDEEEEDEDGNENDSDM